MLRRHIATKAKSVIVNSLIKEVALHLAPLGLDVQGLHIWSEKNESADALSRVANGGEMPRWLGAMSVPRSAPISPEPHLWRHCGIPAGPHM